MLQVFDDIDDLTNYISDRDISGYILIAVDKEEQDYYISFDCTDAGLENLLCLTEYLLEDLNTRRILNG